LANLGGRLTVVTSLDDAGVPLEGIDVQRASEGRFSPSVPEAYERWAELCPWAAQVEPAHPDAVVRIDRELLGPPSPEPAQVFAIGLNYQAHAAETGVSEQVRTPPTFTKFRTCLTGAFASVELPSDSVDWRSNSSPSSARARATSARPMPGTTSPVSRSDRASRTGRCR